MDEDDLRVTWKPEVGRVFAGHGPGCRFIPDGKGGGTLEYVAIVQKPGFRPRPVVRRIQKQAHAA